MNSGIVKFFNSEKGFGFIKDDESGKDIFVHATGLNETIKENDKVVYDITDGKKADICTNVNLQ